MSCNHCAMSVKKELSTIDGLTINSVTIGSAEVNVDESKILNEQLVRAIEQAGYSVSSIQ